MKVRLLDSGRYEKVASTKTSSVDILRPPYCAQTCANFCMVCINSFLKRRLGARGLCTKLESAAGHVSSALLLLGWPFEMLVAEILTMRYFVLCD